jgi:ribosomal protein S18 acetylase RimI-like enzyme
MRAVHGRLCEILIDAVDQGASVGFLSPVDLTVAGAFWRRIESAVADSRSILLVASLADEIVGTVEIDMDTLPNSPHRATIHKLLVHSAARRRGVGETLMREAEHVASEAGRWLLTLDTATPEARRLYERMGWRLSGVIPDYALNPDGSLTDTWVYWKRLPGAELARGPGHLPAG